MRSPHPHPDSARRARGRAGFTLLELLVVIAIIALVAGLSVPAISKAYGVAAETACTSNLRSLAQATAAYTADSKQRFPAGTGTAAWYVNLVGDRGDTGSGYNLPPEQRLLNPYINDAFDVGICPLDRGTTTYGNADTVASVWGSSYVMMDASTNNLALRRVRNGIWSLEGSGLLDVRAPATKMVMADFIVLRNLGSSEQHAWHGSKDGHLRSSMGFVDGHAEALRLKLEPASVYQSTTTLSYTALEQLSKETPYY